jgi:hypothetical protein
VAVLPLSTATHRRLGGPLPHQLANAPQDHLIAFPEGLLNILRCLCISYPVLATVSSSYPRL